MRKELLCVLLGVVLASGAFLVRDAIRAYDQLDQRVHFVEGYIAALDQMLRSGR